MNKHVSLLPFSLIEQTENVWEKEMKTTRKKNGICRKERTKCKKRKKKQQQQQRIITEIDPKSEMDLWLRNIPWICSIELMWCPHLVPVHNIHISSIRNFRS